LQYIANETYSVVLISPTNQVLLLHRVQTSTSFPSAHVFPGGNVSAFHDGLVPGPEDPKRHVDGDAYRLAAIRETFEESGILLAHSNGSGRLVEVGEEEREAGRKSIHKGEIPFRKWLSQNGGRPDVDGLIPFTRWITPIGPPKRFTTQMYLYFLPTNSAVLDKTPLSSTAETIIPTPTPDGGVEHTAAQFLPAEKWLEMARSGKVIMFPPQFFLLSMVSKFLTQNPSSGLSIDVLEKQRNQLKEFARSGDPPWTEVCISPQALIGRIGDGRTVLSLDTPGERLEKRGRRGTREYVVIVEFSKAGPRKLQLKTRKEVTEDLKNEVQAAGTAYSHHLQHIQTKKTENL
jgi:8-oxo-dGTP pyrophosphatase MutT (NUDIX family)